MLFSGLLTLLLVLETHATSEVEDCFTLVAHDPDKHETSSPIGTRTASTETDQFGLHILSEKEYDCCVPPFFCSLHPQPTQQNETKTVLQSSSLSHHLRKQYSNVLQPILNLQSPQS